jgi:multimeric flavodoxin WrbA
MKSKFTILLLLVTVFSVVITSCNSKQPQEDKVDKAVKPQSMAAFKTGSKSVLIISSSPRRGGNSETLCQQFRKGAEDANHMVEMINLNDYDIKFYAQTEYDTEFAEEDDAIRIIRKMAAADVIVLSTPVYFYNMTGQMKTLIDRVFKYEKDLQNKEFYYIITAADGPDALDETITGFRGFLRCLFNSWERGIVRGHGAMNRGEIDGKPAIKEAYDMGRGV